MASMLQGPRHVIIFLRINYLKSIISDPKINTSETRKGIDMARGKSESKSIKAKGNESASTRKASGLILMIFGAVNLLGGILTFIVSGVLSVVLFITLIALITGGSGSDEPMAEFCIVFIIIILIVVFIATLFVFVIASLFSIALAGQSIAGYLTFRGRRYGKAVMLAIAGISASLIAAVLLIILGVNEIKNTMGIVAVGAGIFEVISAIASTIALVMMIRSRDTFIKKSK